MGEKETSKELSKEFSKELSPELFAHRGADRTTMESISRPNVSFWQDAWRRLKRTNLLSAAC